MIALNLALRSFWNIINLELNFLVKRTSFVMLFQFLQYNLHLIKHILLFAFNSKFISWFISIDSHRAQPHWPKQMYHKLVVHWLIIFMIYQLIFESVLTCNHHPYPKHWPADFWMTSLSLQAPSFYFSSLLFCVIFFSLVCSFLITKEATVRINSEPTK